tara:strand:- start:1273 stop:1404 length:132 start_codon:yes stop_codon:yes gene_type:complete
MGMNFPKMTVLLETYNLETWGVQLNLKKQSDFPQVSFISSPLW